MKKKVLKRGNAMPISWHQECLINAELHHERLVLRMEQAIEDVDRSTADIKKRRAQIDKAIRLHKDEFDPEKFKVDVT